MTHNTKHISPLRQRMIEDMALRKLSLQTQTAYVRTVKNLTCFLDQSPDTATAEDLIGYQFDDLDSAVSGFLADGQTVAVKSQLFVSLTAPGFETGGAASIGDPLDLSASAFSGSFSVVPVPAAVWLFGSGLLGLVGMARRKKA